VSPPIIIIHKGDSPYLAHCIAQAKSSNPASRLILLGDRSNSYYLGVEHHYYKDYFIEAENFALIFQYKYFPTYQYSWILFCHQKYFALRDFCKREKLFSFVLIDSDVMIYEDIGVYIKEFKDFAITLNCINPISFEAGAGFAIVNDSQILDKLCKIYKDLFSDSGSTKRDRIKTNLFNEMIGLYFLMEDHPNEVKNIHEYKHQNFVINNSIQEDDRFEYEGNFLKVVWNDGIPYLVEKKSGKLIKTPNLHFHGKGKYIMGKYLKIKCRKVVAQHLINKVINITIKYPARLVNVFEKEFFPKI
jgi:hypothetical protein